MKCNGYLYWRCVMGACPSDTCKECEGHVQVGTKDDCLLCYFYNVISEECTLEDFKERMKL